MDDDPAALALWERLRRDLIDVYAQPGMLQYGNSPTPGSRRPPVQMCFAPHAEAEQVAARLHAEYGSLVAIQLGALPYPLAADATSSTGYGSRTRPTEVARDELIVELDGALSVRRGRTVTHGVLLTNVSSTDIAVRTNREITAFVIDPDSGRIIGGHSGGQHDPLQIFTIAAGQTVRIPLVVGTASFEPRLGHAVPLGSWQLIAPMDLGDSGHVASPPLPFTVTA